MGTEAEMNAELEDNLPTGEEVVELAGDQETDSPSPEEPEGFDVVLDGDPLPGSDVVPLGAHIHEKRKWKEKVHEREKSLEALQAENQLLRMQVTGEDKPKELKRPTRESANYDEDLYEQQLEEYLTAKAEQRAAKVVEDKYQEFTSKGQQSQKEKEIDAAMTRHYEAAKKLGVNDFDEAENRVIGLFGQQAAQQLIAGAADSSKLVYWLGHPANSEIAERYAQMLKVNPVKATMALGQLEAGLKKVPKNKPTTVPDEPPIGGTTPSNSAAWQRKLDKIRESGKPGAIRDAIALKNEALKAGITLE